MRLYVACMDEESGSLLRNCGPGLVTVSEAGARLRRATRRASVRPVADYCKSMKPSLWRYVLEDGSDRHFLDADLMFFSDPAPMFGETRPGLDPPDADASRAAAS